MVQAEVGQVERVKNAGWGLVEDWAGLLENGSTKTSGRCPVWEKRMNLKGNARCYNTNQQSRDVNVIQNMSTSA